MNTQNQKTTIVILGGGSFQGKSLIANRIAVEFNLSASITTDTIRNILHAQSPRECCYSTSTYLMHPNDLSKQMIAVSTLIQRIIPMYESRGESVLFEGMHFTREFLSWAKMNHYSCVCMNSLVPLENRILLKKVTRSIFHFIDEDGREHFEGISESNLQKSSYIKHKNRIQEITNEIVNDFKSLGCPIVEFTELDKCFVLVADYILNQ